MRSKSLLSAALLCFAMMITGVRSGSAQEVQPLEPEWLLRMYEQGWQKVQEGVLQRSAEGGSLATFTYGEEGLLFSIHKLEERLAFFQDAYDQEPTDELAQVIDRLNEQLSEANAEVGSVEAEPFHGGADLETCNVAYDAHAYTASLVGASAPGVTATADAYFHNDCGYTGFTDTYAYAKVTIGTTDAWKGQQDPKGPGTWIDSYATASMSGSIGCYSWAWARSWSTDAGFDHFVEAPANYNCPSPVAASITGPSVATTDYYASPCVDVTWTANASGGAAGYTYQWFIGTEATVQSTDATFTENYCETDALVTARVVVRDANGSTDEATFQTQLEHIGPLTATVSGPSQVDSVSCVDVTWAASVQEGHPGYTYQWYMGIGSPAVGTNSSSYTQRFCNTTETVTVLVVVRDSDGHTIEATRQTQIIGTPVVTISGPATVNTDYYTSACADVTWTANVTGGSPALTYKWYIGSGTTVQGAGATFTKQYCQTNGSVTVRVVVTDSRSLTDDATLTTTLQYRALIVGSISGPGTVSTNTTTPCADVTWTASATSAGGHHSGFTYRWYFGTTLQGSGSTLTKRYCSTSQSVAVRLVVKASDNHTSEVTKTTTITHTPTPPPPAPTIGGPTEVYLGFACQDVTWTVSTTSGTSPYTYSWYVGTTLVGSGTSYTKNYCRTNQTVNLKVVARDSAGKTGEDLHTTNVYYEDPYTTCVVEEDSGSSNTNIPVNPCN